MKPMTKGVLVALIQILVVSSLGAKLLYDRRTCPQAWFKAERFDPNLPIRGRYVSLALEVNDSRPDAGLETKPANEIQAIEGKHPLNGNVGSNEFVPECGFIAIREGSPVAEFDQSPQWDCDNLRFMRRKTADGVLLRLAEPSLFFIPDTAKDPTILPRGDELWVLATLPRKGPPRPVMLGVKKAGEKDIRPLGLD